MKNIKIKNIILILFIVLFVIFAFADNQKIFINKIKCVTCRDCVNTCPVGAIKIENNKAIVDYEKCINCYLCVKSCSYKAITKINYSGGNE